MIRNLLRMAVICLSAAMVAQAADSLSITLEDKAGKPLSPSNDMRFTVKKSETTGGVETWSCRLESTAEGERFVRIVAAGGFRANGTLTVYDGAEAFPAKFGKGENSVLTNGHFPLVAAWDEHTGLAMALGAEDHNSFATLRRAVDEKAAGVSLELVVNAALLRKGATYDCTFHRFAFSPKYGIREAFARYYPLYSRRFFRDQAVDPRIYGISASYAAWRHSDSETTRLCHADWEWCYAAGRSWGDVLNRVVPTRPCKADYSYDERLYCSTRTGKTFFRYNADETVESWDALIAERLADCRYCNVASGFYMMMLSNISKAVAKPHSDSLETVNPVVSSGYPYAPSVYTFPECSWGREARRQLAALAKKHSFEAVAFDVSCSGSVYRGIRLKEMSNVGFDRYGAGVVRGVGSAKLFEFIRALSVKDAHYRMAVAENNGHGHVSDKLYADMRMVESAPWDFPPPFPLGERLTSGEKGLTLWEYDYDSFDPNYKSWPKADLDQFKRDLIRFSMQRSFYAGVQLSAVKSLSDTEYGMRMSEAMDKCVKAAWKPVVGAKLLSEGKGEVARFGSGQCAYLTVNNPVRQARRLELEVFPAEIDSGLVGGTAKDAIVFVPYFGGKTELTVDGGEQTISFCAGAQLVAVLEAVGRARGKGRFAAGWEGSPGLVTLTVISKDFEGELLLRDAIDDYRREGADAIRLTAGDKVKIVYRDAFALAALAKTEGASALTVSDDAAGTDAADAVNAFLRKARVPTFSVKKSSQLLARTLCVGSLTVSAKGHPELMCLVRRMLDVWQCVRYPSYRPGAPLEPGERAFFSFWR